MSVLANKENILSFWFEQNHLVVETENGYQEYSLILFETWFELNYKELVQEYKEPCLFEVEDYYYNEMTVNWSELKREITKEHVLEFVIKSIQ